VDAEYALFLTVVFDVAARAGVFDALFAVVFDEVLDAAEVCANDGTGTNTSVDATTAKDTTILLKRFGFAIEK
jgi:hypothetical protein